MISLEQMNDLTPPSKYAKKPFLSLSCILLLFMMLLELLGTGLRTAYSLLSYITCYCSFYVFEARLIL